MILPNATVLVVDDEPSVRRGLLRALEQAGYHALEAANGHEASDVLSRTIVEVMLLDIRMPGASGLDVLQEVVVKYPDISVIMATALGETRVAVDAMKAGAYDYILKPFDLAEVMLRVRKAYERRHLVLKNRAYQQELERRVKEQEERLQAQFAELVQSLAREHSMVFQLGALHGPKETGRPSSLLPPELQSPKASVEEFAQALLRILRNGSLLKR